MLNPEVGPGAFTELDSPPPHLSSGMRVVGDLEHPATW